MEKNKAEKKRMGSKEAFNEINSNRRGRIRTFIKKVEAAIESGDAAGAREALKVAQPEMHRGVTRGVFHRNTISRKLSRLSARIKAIAA